MPGRSACSAALPAIRPDIDRHLALIAGTSSCVMAMSAEPRPFAGVWGPVFRRGPAGALAERGRPVGDRRAARPSDRLAWRGRRAEGRPMHAQDRRARSRELRAAEGARPRRPPARAAGFPRQPLAARRSACARRDQRADARRLLRQPVPALLAHLRRHRARRPAHPRCAERRTAMSSTRCTSPAATPRTRC